MVSPRNTKKRNLPFVVDYVRGHATHRVDIFFSPEQRLRMRFYVIELRIKRALLYFRFKKNLIS